MDVQSSSRYRPAGLSGPSERSPHCSRCPGRCSFACAFGCERRDGAGRGAREKKRPGKEALIDRVPCAKVARLVKNARRGDGLARRSGRAVRFDRVSRSLKPNGKKAEDGARMSARLLRHASLCNRVSRKERPVIKPRLFFCVLPTGLRIAGGRAARARPAGPSRAGNRSTLRRSCSRTRGRADCCPSMVDSGEMRPGLWPVRVSGAGLRRP